MKNIHAIPTDKPSELYINMQGCLSKSNSALLRLKSRNIYITNSEEIKKGDWCINPKNNKVMKVGHHGHHGYSSKKIILTTDQELIKDGVQAIDDEFLEWFVKNPSCEEVKVEITEISCIIPNFGDVDKHKIIIPSEESKKIFNLPIATNLGSALTETMKSVSQHEGGIRQGETNLPNFKEEVIKTEEDAKIFVETMENIPEPNDKLKKAFKDFNKQETLEEAAERISKNYSVYETGQDDFHQGFILGAKWQQERMYSEEDMRKMYDFGSIGHFTENESLEQFKKK